MTSVSIAGCGDGFRGSDPGSADDAIEVTVEKRTPSPADVAVRVTDGEGGTLFSRVFALEPGTITSRGAIGVTPTSVHAFTPGGVSHTWRYAPDLLVDFDCERADVGLTLLGDDTIEPWYTC